MRMRRCAPLVALILLGARPHTAAGQVAGGGGGGVGPGGSTFSVPSPPPPVVEGTAAISGIVVDGSAKTPLAGAIVNLSLGGGSVGLPSRQLTDAKGRFAFPNLGAGTRYTITASMARADPTQGAPAAVPSAREIRSGGGAPPGATTGREYLYAVADVDARGDDVTGIALLLQPGSMLAGHLKFESTSMPVPQDLSNVRITLGPPNGTFYLQSGGTLIGNSFSAVPALSVAADGSFVARSIAPGSYVLRGSPPPDLAQSWRLLSAIVKGRDLLDETVEFIPGQNVTDVVLTFSDRHTELSGSLLTPAGLPASPYFVVVFPADRSLWRAGSRRVASTRPGSDGKYAFRDLPSGDYFLAALTDLDPTDWSDPPFLEQVMPAAIKVPLGPGEKKVQDLRIAGR